MKKSLIKFSAGIFIVANLAAVTALAQAPIAPPAAVTAPVAKTQEQKTVAPAVQSAQTMSGYRYSWNECEYSLELPEAPRIKSLWAEDDLPDFEKGSSLGIIGEQASFKRAEWQTKDFMHVEITCVHVTPEFLKTMTSKKMLDYLESAFRDVSFENKKKNFSPGSQTLSWATIAGYEFDKDKKMIYNIGHYLTGLKTVTIIKIQYVADNPAFVSQYNMIDQSIMLNKD